MQRATGRKRGSKPSLDYPTVPAAAFAKGRHKTSMQDRVVSDKLVWPCTTVGSCIYRIVLPTPGKDR